MGGNVSIVSVGQTAEEQKALLMNVEGMAPGIAELIMNSKCDDSGVMTPVDPGFPEKGVESSRPAISETFSYSPLGKEVNPIYTNGPKLKG